MKLFSLLLFPCLAISAAARELVAVSNATPLRSDNSFIVCGSGFSSSDCSLAVGITRLALQDLRIKIPGWRWVVVPTSRWKQTAQSFGVKLSVPAFSSFAVSTTYLQFSLVLLDQRMDENLQSFTNLSGMPGLRWVLAHELGHIVRRTSHDAGAEANGKRISSGNRAICR